MDALPDDIVLYTVQNLPKPDRWLLPLVSRRFRRLFPCPVPATPQRDIRVLDHNLEKAIKGGGLATVRMLAGRHSCVWSEGVEMAAALGDLEMVKLLVSIEKAKQAKDNKTAIVAALSNGHVKIADFLWTSTAAKSDYIFLMAAANSGSRAALAWVWSYLPIPISIGKSVPVLLQTLARVGDLPSVEFFLDRIMSTTLLLKHWVEFQNFKFGSTNVGVLRLIDERLGILADPCEIVRMPNHHEALAHLEKTLGRNFMARLLSVPAHLTWDYHGYLRSTGRGDLVEIDIEKCLRCLCNFNSNLEQARRVEIITKELHADPARLHDILSKLQNYYTAQHILAMLAVGGRCDIWTFYNACKHNTVDVARLVWQNMDGQEREKVSLKWQQRNQFYRVTDSSMLAFFQDEVGIELLSYEVSVRKETMTFVYSKKIFDNGFFTAWQILQAAIMFQHADIVEHFAPLCTTTQLEEACKRAMTYPAPEIVSILRRCISTRGHPWLRWLRRLI